MVAKARRATSRNRITVTHRAAGPRSAPATRPMYIAPGIMIMPTKMAPSTDLRPNPSSNWSGGFIRSRYSRSSLSSCIVIVNRAGTADGRAKLG